MKVRTQVQFEEEQYVVLKRLARESGRSLSELLRQIVALHLDSHRAEPDPWDDAWAVIGLGQGGPTDLSEQHDRYLWE